MEDLLNLTWTDFSFNIREVFKVLKSDKDLQDVTLVCDDGEVDAHKIILYSGSSFFQPVLSKSKHQHPLLYMKGVKINHLQAILDFMYNGEVNVANDDLKEFINTAKDLQIKGLTGKETEIELGPDRTILGTENASEFVSANSGILDLISPGLVENKEEIKEENTMEDDLESEEHKYIEIYKEKCQYIPDNNCIEVGQTYASKEDVLNQVQLFSDSNFSPLVIYSCSESAQRNNRLRMSYRCPYGIYKKSTSTGKRNISSRYVGCPVVLNFNQQADNGMIVVTKAELEHKDHDVGEEEYFARSKKKLSEDEKGAVRAFLETKPSNQEVSLFLTDLTGRKYNTKQAHFIVKKLKIKNE